MYLQSYRDHIAHDAPDESPVVVHKGTDPHKLDSYILSISILNGHIPRFPVPQPRSMAWPYLQATLHLSITTLFSCLPSRLLRGSCMFYADSASLSRTDGNECFPETPEPQPQSALDFGGIFRILRTILSSTGMPVWGNPNFKTSSGATPEGKCLLYFQYLTWLRVVLLLAQMANGKILVKARRAALKRAQAVSKLQEFLHLSSPHSSSIASSHSHLDETVHLGAAVKSND
ncbi:hypothetical protein B0H19DRAFT_1077941 [Mycena capillaripes]|nr:hypothetical protein B0H19DRAFT_1077941 [Mycena capillaripes]